jgi:signal transduction histidine kinase
MTDPLSLDRRDASVEGDLRLPKPPGVIRQFWYRHPRLTDALVAVAYAAPALAFALLTAVATDAIAERGLVPFGVALVLLGGAALLFRRSRPWTVLVVAWIVVVLSVPAFGSEDQFITIFALYALAVYGSVRAAWIGYAGSVAVGIASGYLVAAIGGGSPNDTPFGTGLSFAVVLLIAVLVGINIGNRRRYVIALVDRAAQLARERDQQAQLAAAAERARIAREMHDIVSHGLTVMVTLADGSAATAAAQPDRAAEAMRKVAETGRQALVDMRRMLGLLDDGTPGLSGSAELAPQPGVAEIGALVDGFRAAGLAIRLSTRGNPPADPSEQLTVYRLVQESLTNVLRHSASATIVTVDVSYSPDGVVIEVGNDGLHAPEPTATGGHGIVGMRERVALYGGTVESGPRPGGGWNVVATLAHDPGPNTENEADEK